MSNDLARLMFAALELAIPKVQSNDPVDAGDHRFWSLFNEEAKKHRWSRKLKPTGKLALVCLDDGARKEFTRLARAAGCTVEEPRGREYTVLITPKKHN
jgi:hypothetical protein